MTKRIFAGFLAIWFALVSSSAFAFLPLVMSAFRIAAVALETPQGRQLIAAPIGIGIAIVAAHLTRTDGTNSRYDDLYTTTAPRPPSATEAAAGFTAGSPSLVPASTSAPLNNFNCYTPMLVSSIISSGVDASTCFSNHAAALKLYFGGNNLVTVGSVSGNTGVILLNGTAYSGSAFSIFSCSVGYSLSGSTCVLSSAVAVPRPTDGACPIIRSGNSYTTDPTDPDCSNGQAPLVLTDATGQTISSTDTSGAKFSFHVNTDGTSTITTETPDTATNTTKKRVISIGTSSNGTTPPLVTGVQDSTLSGTGSTTTAPPAATGADPALLAAQQTANASLQDLQAKAAAEASDRNAAATAAAALPAALPAAPWNINALGLPTQNQFSLNAPSIAMPSHTGCVPLHLPFGIYDAQVDTCEFVITFTPIFNWLIVMMGVSSGVWQVFNRKT